MSHPVYRQLLDVMKKRGGEFPGMDIPEFFAMVEVMFTPAEAEVNNAMPRGPFTAQDLAKAMGRDAAEIQTLLEGMADKGLCTALRMGAETYYQSARFMPGILEFQFMPGRSSERDKLLAKVIYAYKKAYDAKSDLKSPAFPTNRVITVDRTVAAGNQVHTYDQVHSYIEQNDQIAVTTCFCRHAAVLRGEDIHGMPNDTCMQFGMAAQFAVERLNGRMLSKVEARALLERCEEAGLIHMSINMTKDIGFICNCDRWHCVAVTHALAKTKPALYFNSGFQPSFDAELCTACETCLERCPATALSMGPQEVPVVDLDRCFGCAVCATGCPTEAIAMVNRPGFMEPPKDGKALKEAMVAASRS
ncbi:MAG: 4Fe-4S binding protein [Desulfobacterales bacterium]|nr:4Fe-4S binding protein [Desulfobacterales bacterium]